MHLQTSKNLRNGSHFVKCKSHCTLHRQSWQRCDYSIRIGKKKIGSCNHQSSPDVTDFSPFYLGRSSYPISRLFRRPHSCDNSFLLNSFRRGGKITKILTTRPRLASVLIESNLINNLFHYFSKNVSISFKYNYSTDRHFQLWTWLSWQEFRSRHYGSRKPLLTRYTNSPFFALASFQLATTSSITTNPEQTTINSIKFKIIPTKIPKMFAHFSFLQFHFFFKI